MIALKQTVIPATIVAVSLMCGAILVADEFSEQAVGAAIRATAGASFILLTLAFSATALSRRFGGGAWQPVLQAAG